MEIQLQSKSGQPLARYFPEMVASLLSLGAKPFDLLVDAKGQSLVSLSLDRRRKMLEAFGSRFLKNKPNIRLSHATRDPAQAKNWLRTMRGQWDGIVAKRIDQPYVSGERAMVKVKNIRSADCVVGGFRYAAGKRVVGSLLLGLYDNEGLLNHVGFTSSIAAAERRALTLRLEKLIQPPGFTGGAPGGPSRWSTERSTAWEPLKPELVVEVQYDHFTGERFRHGTKLLRWRPDKNPRQCTLKQVTFESKVPFTRLLATA